MWHVECALWLWWKIANRILFWLWRSWDGGYVESTLWMDMVDIRIFWNMVDWMDDMVDWMDDMVWKDKWIEPTSGMKTMAARLLSDKIIVLKHIVLLVLHTEWSRSGWPIILCVNYYNYDQLYIDENNGYDLCEELTLLQTRCPPSQACWTLSCASSPFLTINIITMLTITMLMMPISIIPMRNYDSGWRWQWGMRTHQSRQWRGSQASDGVYSQGGSVMSPNINLLMSLSIWYRVFF